MRLSQEQRRRLEHLRAKYGAHVADRAAEKVDSLPSTEAPSSEGRAPREPPS